MSQLLAHVSSSQRNVRVSSGMTDAYWSPMTAPRRNLAAYKASIRTDFGTAHGKEELHHDEFSALVEDIRANGQRQPIYIHDGKIVDGRNRYRACQQLGIEPDTRAWDGVGSLVAFVVSLNLQRRHLTSSQKAVVAMDVLPMLEAEAKERYVSGVGRPSVTEKSTQLIGGISEEPRERHANEAVQQAAQMVGTNRRYVSDAKRLRDEAPELLERVRSGELTIPQAKMEPTIRRDGVRLKPRACHRCDGVRFDSA